MAGVGVYVSALGASTPLVRDAWASAAAARAGISGFTERPFMIDTAGESMRVAMAPWLDVTFEGLDRFEALLPAIKQALAPIVAADDASVRVVLALGLPPPRPGLPSGLDGLIRATIASRMPNRFGAVATFPVGHAGGFLGLHTAFQKISDGAVDACVVAGVDSYVAPETLEGLEAQDQFHGAGPLNNAWGFIPGEAAGAALILNEPALGRLSAPAYGRLCSVGKAYEPTGSRPGPAASARS